MSKLGAAGLNYWLIDGDNQSPQLAAQAADLFGWPKVIVVAGVEQNLSSWRRLPVPPHVTTEYLVAPRIPDSADVLLSIAVGTRLHELDSVAIFSRDTLVAGTLGRILVTKGVRVLAISAIHHPGLPYPHLTLPVNEAARIETPPADEAITPTTVGNAHPMPKGGPVQPLVDSSSLTEKQANAIVNSIFLEAMTVKVRKADFCNLLNGRGFDLAARAKLFSTATNYKIEVINAIHYVVRP